MAKTLDLTNGPIARKLLMFALPLLGASLIQQLYNVSGEFQVNIAKRVGT